MHLAVTTQHIPRVPRYPPPRYTVKEIGATLDSIELADLRPLASRVLAEAEGMCLMQGNLQKEDVPRYDTEAVVGRESKQCTSENVV